MDKGLIKCAEMISEQVDKMHEGRTSWNRHCGQWLVYGFENVLGFFGAAELEARVERAWRAKQSVRDAVIKFLEEIRNERKNKAIS